MSKKITSAFAFAAATALSSIATAGDMATYPESVDAGPGLTRAQVVQEMLDFKRNPVVGGWRLLDSEVGWAYVGTPPEGVKSREQVRRELDAFQRDRAAQARFARTYGAS